MTAAHTKGPWEGTGVEESPIPSRRKSKERRAFKCAVFGPASDPLPYIASARGDSAEEARANARLIAAAPDLLAACEAMMRSKFTGGSIGFRSLEVLDPVYDLARSAIARAKGGGA